MTELDERTVWYTLAHRPTRGQRATIGVHLTLAAARDRASKETSRTDGYGHDRVDIVEARTDTGTRAYAPAPTLVESIRRAK